jgi:hypothetical protein
VRSPFRQPRHIRELAGLYLIVLVPTSLIALLLLNGEFEGLTAPGVTNSQSDLELFNTYFQTASLDVSVGVFVVLFAAVIGVIQFGSRFQPSGVGPRADQLRMIRPLMIIAGLGAAGAIGISVFLEILITDGYAWRPVAYAFWSIVAAGAAIELLAVQLLSLILLLQVMVEMSGVGQDEDDATED